MWLSLVEHYVRDVGAAGSNPVIPTTQNRLTNRVGRYFYFSQISFYILPVIITSKDNPFPVLLTGRFFHFTLLRIIYHLSIPLKRAGASARKLCNLGTIRWLFSSSSCGKKCIESFRCQGRGYVFKTIYLKKISTPPLHKIRDVALAHSFVSIS